MGRTGDSGPAGPRRSVLARFAPLLVKKPRKRRPEYSFPLILEVIFPPNHTSWYPDTLCTYILAASDLRIARVARDAILRTVEFYRYTTGHAVLICKLLHPAYLDAPVSLMLERQTRESTGSDGASCPIDSDAVLIDKPHVLDRSLSFPNLDRQPMLYDLLALAGLVTERNKVYTINRSCVFYATTIYSALQELFDGHSEEMLQPAPSSAPPSIPSGLNDYTRKAEIKAVVGGLPNSENPIAGQY
ncbi:hypothetical protein B0H19DRAFT_1246125 [Mycena capillaripes]|nr:hypothetical protein B0H19DRAFT_1246125 [Mycena capillaripes]